MSWMDCIDRALAAKKITGKRADEARTRYKNLYQNAIDDGMPALQAEDHAANMATSQIEAEKVAAKTKQLAQAAWAIDDYRQWQKGGASHLKWDAQSVIEGTVGSTPGRISLNDRATVATGRIEKYLGDMLEKYSPKYAGLIHPTAGLENIVRELFHPGSTGDKMAEGIAKAWIKATDMGVFLYRKAGGALNHLEEWRMPQRMSRTKMIKAGGEFGATWIEDHKDWLDWDKMQWPNGARIDPADRERVLGEVYKTMKTGGDYRIKPGQFRGAGGGSLENHRFMIYKDADSWLKAHGKYGDGSIYDAMMAHVKGMGRRIGVAETFGPSPAMGLQQMISNMRKVAADADVAAPGSVRTAGALIKKGLPTTYKDEATAAENYLKDAFKVTVEGMNAPENGSSGLAAGMLSSTRTVLMSALAGSVYLFQGNQDFYTAAMRYRLAGLPVSRAVGTYLKTFLPGMGRNETARTLGRAGFINLSQTNLAHSMTRLTGVGPEGSALAKRMADVVSRASFTEWHATAARFTTAAEFCGAMADWKDKAFADVPMKRMLEMHGIDEADWDKMRSTPLQQMKGHDFLFPDNHIEANGHSDESYAVADKFMSMINQEAKLATIETQVAAQLAVKGPTRPGTLSGEIMRSAAMFKNFPLTFFNTHIRQALLQGNSLPGKLAYAGSVIFGMTMFGAVGVVLHDIVAGKNPQSMLSSEFWVRALLASGGAGIFGDMLGGNLEHGKTLGETLGGPPIEFGSDLINLGGEAGKLALGEKNNFMKKANEIGSRWMPGATLWQTRAAVRALIWDNLLKATDPQSAEVFRRRAKFAQQNGQDYWWGPGEELPHEAPDLTALVRK